MEDQGMDGALGREMMTSVQQQLDCSLSLENSNLAHAAPDADKVRSFHLRCRTVERGCYSNWWKVMVWEVHSLCSTSEESR